MDKSLRLKIKKLVLVYFASIMLNACSPLKKEDIYGIYSKCDFSEVKAFDGCSVEFMENSFKLINCEQAEDNINGKWELISDNRIAIYYPNYATFWNVEMNNENIELHINYEEGDFIFCKE